MMASTFVLILGLFDTAISTARCLKKTGVQIYGLDYNPFQPGFHSRIIKTELTPDPRKDENIWITFILEWIKKSGKHFILFPTSDEFVLLTARHNKELSQYCSFIVPTLYTIETIISRMQQFNMAKASELKVPSYIDGKQISASQAPQELEYPLVVKPADIIRWKKFYYSKGFILQSPDEWEKRIEDIKSKKIPFIVQNIITGDNSNNYEVNSLFLPNGKLYQHSIRKVRQYPDRFGTASCIEYIVMPNLEAMAAKFIRDLNLIGFSNIEFKFHQADGEFYYIETNPRVWQQVNFSAKMGINFPRLYLDFLQNQLNFYIPNLKNKGKWVDFLPDILFWKKYRKIYQLSIFALITSWFPIKATGLFSITDPLPFLYELKSKKIHNRKNITK
jgi:D-aspartate ligase